MLYFRVMQTIAIFASGAGSNALQMINRFKYHSGIRVGMIISNKADAGVVGIAQNNNIPVVVLDKEKFFRGNAYTDELIAAGIDFIVLAGFLWKVPPVLITAFAERIINIHPALLPKYGGKGMYGSFVHEAVLKAGEVQSGITIHYVDTLYDHGKTIFQQKCSVGINETPETLAQKVHRLEHLHYPVVIEAMLI